MGDINSVSLLLRATFILMTEESHENLEARYSAPGRGPMTFDEEEMITILQ
jgi:hypothetical protein